jgi:hypothetical protein
LPDAPAKNGVQNPNASRMVTVADEVRERATTLRDVSAGLAASLRIAAARRNASPAVVETFREADSLSLTVTAVLDQSSAWIALLTESAAVVGRRPFVGAPGARVCNGFDALAAILLSLLREAIDAGMLMPSRSRMLPCKIYG